jgi:Protein kinase domain
MTRQGGPDPDDLEGRATGTAPQPPKTSRPGVSTAPGSAPPVAGDFPPGTVIASRYRIAGLIGEGGMGRVFRADDLLLGIQVALKFLPESLRDDPDRLARFYGEVRIAREISHPNVCRVHDIGEVDGTPFLSMEYVDGDSLASLLRRAGRMSGERASEVARQICAGLSAAHGKGVLHRDLKPDNVIIDGRGKVRLADFGLAAWSGGIEKGDVRSGTPAYMSPEQIEGREVTTASDIYSLGLVLYEIFTGKRPFEGKSAAEYSKAHREETPGRPSAHVTDLSPAVEEIVLQCLEKDPANRPPSALAVAAALPGGDALAQALAAGEVPSAALLATAKSHDHVAPRFAFGAVGLLVLAYFGVPRLSNESSFLRGVPMEKPPAVLEFDARAHLKSFGYGPGVDSASGYDVDDDYVVRPIEELSLERERVRAGWPVVLRYWHRESPRGMEPWSLTGRVTMGNPPLLQAGMTRTLVDTRGRLVSLDATPPSTEEPADPKPAPWDALFAAAGLDRTRFTETAPAWNPPVHSDARAAWKGSSADWPELAVRVEAASYRGQPVYFRIVYPWTNPERSGIQLMTRSQRIASGIYFSLFVGTLAIAGYFAWRNLRAGQGDQRGGLRLALAVMAADLGSWFLGAHILSDPISQIVSVLRAIGGSLLVGSMTFTLYLALEPDVRKRSPDLIMGWTRFIWGRWRDPRVGRDMLIGIAAAAATGLAIRILVPLTEAFGAPPGSVSFMNVDFVRNVPAALAVILAMHQQAPAIAMGVAVAFLLLERLLKTRARAAMALVILLAIPNMLQQGTALWAGALFAFTVMGLPVLAFVRGGMLAFATFATTVIALVDVPLTSDFSHWTAPPTFVVGLVLAAWAYVALRSVGALETSKV